MTDTESFVTLRARVAAHSRWAFEADWTRATEPARQKFMEKFYVLVDPENVLPQEEREKRAASLRSAYFAKLALQRHKKAKEKNEEIS